MKAINKVKELLENRNLDSIHISNIPKPQSMKGVEEASEIIKNAILENKKIAIVGLSLIHISEPTRPSP